MSKSSVEKLSSVVQVQNKMSSVVQVQNKLSSVEKLQNKLSTLQATYSKQENIVKRDRQECRRFEAGADMLFESRQRAKQEYLDAMKEATSMRRELYKKRVALGKTQSQIRIAELQLSLTSSNERQKEEKKAMSKKMKKGTILFSDPLLQKINCLPEDLVVLIGTFLPEEVFSIKNHILESMLKTNRLLSRCSAALKKSFLTSFCRTRQFLALLPYNDAVAEVSLMGNRYYYSDTVKETEVKILHLLEMAKASNPKFAHHILKTLHILIDPSKKYKCKKFAWNENPFKNLTEEDVENRYIF